MKRNQSDLMYRCYSFLAAKSKEYFMKIVFFQIQMNLKVWSIVCS